MAGQFVTILNPGYSTLYTRDLAFQASANVEGSASMNVFNPDVAHPLQEGEWLQMSAGKFTRSLASGAVTGTGSASALAIVDDAQNAAASRPCFLYFQERGRYDAQLTRKAHCITGPSGFEFRTKMIVCDTGDEGEQVYVYVCEDANGRLVSALVSASAAVAASSAPEPAAGSWYAGTILQVHGTNDATVLFQPGYKF
jgi:hypothetical protein